MGNQSSVSRTCQVLPVDQLFLCFQVFNVLVLSAGNSTETATVDENTHEFFTELTEPGTYRVQVTTLSSSGDCEARESSADTGFTFYLSESLEEMLCPERISQRNVFYQPCLVLLTSQSYVCVGSDGSV